jgi:phage/plasmid-like protein (TIGR03299 family)
MAAYFDTGFSVRQPMWHGEGLVLDDYPVDWADARVKAGLTWEPMTITGYNVLPADVAARWAMDNRTTDLPAGWEWLPGGRMLVPAGDRKGIVRSDTFGSLGNASDQFSLIYHSTMGEIMEALTENGLKFETAGSCRDGRQVWALGYLDEPYTVPGDTTEHLPFMALLNNHDGSGACKVTMTQVRVVCWNTFQAASAEGDRTGRQFSFRHVGDVMGRIEDAKIALKGLRSEVDEYVELCAELGAVEVTDEMADRYLSEFLPSPRENGQQCTDRVHDNVERARAVFRGIYNDSITTDSIRGTGFGLLQASTEYLDHARAYQSRDTYLGRSVLRSEPAKAKAVNLIRGLV